MSEANVQDFNKEPAAENAANDGNVQPMTEREQIIAWLAQAMRDSKGDAYPGKRDTVRFRDNFELEASVHPEDDAAPMLATMHNISPDGIAFWIRPEMEPGKVIYLHKYASDDNAPWVATKVSHCTRGMRGFLVGSVFVNPLGNSDVPKIDKEDSATSNSQTARHSGKVESAEEEKGGGILGWLGLK